MIKRGLIIMGLLITFVLLPGTTAAQDDGPVRFIPVLGELLITKLSPDGHTLAAFENVNIHNDYEVIPAYLPIQLVNLDTGEMTWLKGFTDYAWDVAFSPDSTRLVSMHGNGEIIVWDLTTQTEINRFWGLPGIRGISLLPDGNTAITRLSPTLVQFGQWDLTSGAITQILSQHYKTYADIQAQFANGMPDSALNFVIAPDGQSFFLVTTYGRIWRWDLVTGEQHLLVDTENERPMLNILNLLLTADGSTLIYRDNMAKTIRIIDAMTGAETAAIEVSIRFEPAVSPDGSRIIWIDKDSGILKQWEAGTITDLMPLPTPEGDLGAAPSSPLPALHLTPDGSRLVFAGYFAEGTGVNMIAVIDLGE